MDYGTLELEIVSYLEGKLDPFGFKVIPLPEKENDFRRGSEGRVVVAFSSESAEHPQSTFQLSQHTTITFSLLIESRLLRGDQGIYRLSELVKQFMIGYEPTNCGLMWYNKQEFVSNEKDVFQHVLEFQTKSLRVQDVEEETGPSFNSITLN